jgi:1,4-alpha-glucan branching enzyme
MLKKNYSTSGNICRVTFRLPAEVDSDSAFLCGEFNQWDAESTPMKKLKDGSFSVTISLDAGQSYRFRYLLDNDRWENDWEADAYLPNQLGTDDSVVAV